MSVERLEKSIRPKNYKIHLKPNLCDFSFKGKVEIELEITAPTEVIKLHSLNLDIEEVVLTNSEGEIKLKNIDSMCDSEMIALNFESLLNKDAYNLKIKFSGKINDDLYGLYKTRTKNENGEETFGCVTHFEPTSARRCFPCFDEPEFKATFDTSITTVPPNTALSNMPKKGITPLDDDEVLYDFETTPPMSTYIFAIVVGEYEYIDGKTSRGTEVAVYTKKGMKEQATFALDVLTKALVYFEDFFGVNYPLPKLDVVGVGDFGAGAMENWGLIISREFSILLDPENSTTRRKLVVAIVVTHEIAHQWFGDLVTMKWWNDLWLNEGFASFMENLGVARLYPELEVWPNFIASDYQSTLDMDGMKNSHPIQIDVENPKEIRQIFDSISYGKGCAVLRMLHHYIEDCSFRKGLFVYLKRFKFQNTETNDLWRCLEAATGGKPIKKIMSTWTQQTGFPLISVSSERQGDGLVLKLNQKRFGTNDSSLWCVPITVSTSTSQGKECAETLLETQDDELSIPNADPNGWVKVNPNLYGFYRVKYSSDLLEKLKQAIIDKDLQAMDRLGIISDLFYLASNGYINTVEYLKFLKIYVDETDAHTWTVILTCLSQITELLRGTGCQKDFANYQKNLLRKISDEVGWQPKPTDDNAMMSLRPTVLTRLLTVEDRDAISEGKAIFDRGDKTSPDMRRVVYRAAVLSGDSKVIDVLLDKFKNSESEDDKHACIIALISSSDPNVLKRIIDFILSNEVPLQDKFIYLSLLARFTKTGGDLVWEYIKNNFEEAKSTFEDRLNYILESYKGHFNTKAEAEEFEKFFQEHDCPEAERTIKQILEATENLTAWNERDYDDIDRYFHGCQCEDQPERLLQLMKEQLKKEDVKVRASKTDGKGEGKVVETKDEGKVEETKEEGKVEETKDEENVEKKDEGEAS